MNVFADVVQGWRDQQILQCGHDPLNQTTGQQRVLVDLFTILRDGVDTGNGFAA